MVKCACYAHRISILLIVCLWTLPICQRIDVFWEPVAADHCHLYLHFHLEHWFKQFVVLVQPPICFPCCCSVYWQKIKRRSLSILPNDFPNKKPFNFWWHISQRCLLQVYFRKNKFVQSNYQNKVCPCQDARTNAWKLELSWFNQDIWSLWMFYTANTNSVVHGALYWKNHFSLYVLLVILHACIVFLSFYDVVCWKVIHHPLESTHQCFGQTFRSSCPHQ